MLDFTFYNPTRVHFGKGQVTALEEELSGGIKKVLVVTGRGSVKKYGIFRQVMEQVQKAGAESVELSGVFPNPRVKKVREGIGLCREEGVDLVLAVGGGSVIDTAKAVAAGAPYGGDVWDFFDRGVRPEEALPVGTVVTLAATGSEMNPNAVITNEEKRSKVSISSSVIRPGFSIMDPVYTFTVNSYHTAAGVADIMAHIFEYYFSPIPETDIQDSLAEALLRQCVKFGPVVCEKGDDYNARAVILWASTLALNGTVGKGTYSDWTCHGLEHELSAYYDISHGAGLAVLLPNYMTVAFRKWGPEKLSRYTREVWGAEGGSERETAVEAMQKTREFFDSLGLPSRLADMDIDSEHFDDMVERLSRVRRTTDHFPQFGVEDLHEVLSRSL